MGMLPIDARMGLIEAALAGPGSEQTRRGRRRCHASREAANLLMMSQASGGYPGQASFNQAPDCIRALFLRRPGHLIGKRNPARVRNICANQVPRCGPCARPRARLCSPLRSPSGPRSHVLIHPAELPVALAAHGETGAQAGERIGDLATPPGAGPCQSPLYWKCSSWSEAPESPCGARTRTPDEPRGDGSCPLQRSHCSSDGLYRAMPTAVQIQSKTCRLRCRGSASSPDARRAPRQWRGRDP